MTEQHGTYVGPDQNLLGCTALIHDYGDHLKAQFDDPKLVWKGKSLGYGWHRFGHADFDLDQQEVWDGE